MSRYRWLPVLRSQCDLLSVGLRFCVAVISVLCATEIGVAQPLAQIRTLSQKTIRKPTSVDFTFAVVFRREGEKRHYSGVMKLAEAGPELRRIAKAVKPRAVMDRAPLVDFTKTAKGDVELWFVGNGVLGAAVIDHRSASMHLPSERSPKPLSVHQLGALFTHLDQAMPSIPRTMPGKGLAGSLPSSPLALFQMCSEAEVIAVGRPVATLRDLPTFDKPAGTKTGQTVTLVVVEEYLKSVPGLNLPVLKVAQFGASQTRRISSGGFETFRSLGEPLLEIGTRYVLFLKLQRPAFPRPGEPTLTSDETLLVHATGGYFILRGGTVFHPSEPFRLGPQVQYLKEEDGLAMIRKWANMTHTEAMAAVRAFEEQKSKRP